MNDAKNRIVELNLNDVLPNRFQPRIKFNEESIIELAESVKEHGVIQPIIVRPIGDKYEIVAGERRYKACVLAGLQTIPAIILDLNDKDSVELALIENIQRRDLTPIEEAISYKKILDMGYLTQEQLAKKLGKSQSAISNKKRLLNLCDEVQEALMEEKISERHARSLLKIENSSEQRKMLNRIITERLTVRKLDEAIKELLENQNSLETSSISLINDEETKPIIPPKEEAIDDEEIIDISKLFDESLFINDDVKQVNKQENVNLKENDIREENQPKAIESVAFGEQMKEDKNGEIDNMMENSQIPVQPEQPVVSSRSFGKFFDPALFEDEDNAAPGGDQFIFNTQPVVPTNTSAPQTASIPLEAIQPVQTSPSSPYIISQPTTQPSTISQPMQTPSPTAQPQMVVQPAPVIESQPQPAQPVKQEETIFPNLVANDNNSGSSDFIDAQTFNNFLDPTYVDGTKQALEPANKNVIDASVFAKFLDPDYDMQSDVNNQEPPVNNSTPVIPSMTFAQYLDSDKSIDQIFSEAQTQPQNIETSVASAQPLNNGVVGQNDSTSSSAKPDLLAPMSDNNNFSFNVTPMSPQQTIEPVQASPVNQPLTPDNSLEQVNNQVVSQPSEPTTQTTAQPVEEEQPLFVTATQPNETYSMPTTPIIDNVDLNALLGATEPPKEEVQISEANTEPEPTIEQTPQILDTSIPTTPSTLESTIPAPINNQPIIVTDYNKQYDPVLPEEMTVSKPKADFKQVLNMIRSLNDQIESLGFQIDTEEYDLQDTYQVVFKINKNDN